MKRRTLLILFISILTILTNCGQTIRDNEIKSFITRMYNENLYEDHEFLKNHCSLELLNKLQDAYPYDTDEPAYATWLFRSGKQDVKPGSDGETIMIEVHEDGDWYEYTALDMGWEFTNRIIVTYKGNKLIINDIYSQHTLMQPENDRRNSNVD